VIRERADYLPYFRALADRLALKDWALVIKPDGPEDSTSDAEVACIMGRKQARLWLSERFLHDTEAEQRHTAIHELVHLHVELASITASKLLDDDEYSLFRLHLEYAVDGLADGIAPLLPLPSEVFA
jgi:hypothetical protein